jgi:hypothetical protein
MTIEKPIWDVIERYPDGTTEGARYVWDRRLAADDQIKIGHDGGRIDERVGPLQKSPPSVSMLMSAGKLPS